MSKDLEARLASLERGYAKEKEAREKAEAEAERLRVENKRVRAQAIDTARGAGHVHSALNTMRDLAQGPENPYSSDARARYEELKSSTLEDKGGYRYYFTDGPAYVGNRYYVGFRNSVKGDPADYIIMMPKETDPSLTWEAVELGGTNPKTGAPIMRPKGTGEKMEQELAARREQLEGQFVTTNSELNAQRADLDRQRSRLGANAGKPAAPGLEKPADGARPSDTTVG